MTELNDKGREIWFERWLWSYMPCHWKGWAVLVAFAAVIIAAIWLLLEAISAVGHPEWDFVPFMPIVPGVIMSWIIAERHCPPKS